MVGTPDELVAIALRAAARRAGRALPPSGRERREIRARWPAFAGVAPRLLWWAVLRRALTGLAALAAVAGCVDPRVPYIEPETTIVNFPPVISEPELVPQPGTEPVLVPIGEACAGENVFSVGDVFDADLQPGAAVEWRWYLVRGGGPVSLRRQLKASSRPNTGADIGAFITVDPIEIDVATLQGAFEVEFLIGDTHRLELRVTDGEFVEDAAAIDVTPPGSGVAFAYWLIELEDRPCL